MRRRIFFIRRIASPIATLLLLGVTGAKSLYGQTASWDMNPVPVYGNDNCGFGVFALNNNALSTGPGNTATGKLALRNNKTGEFNTAIGNMALRDNYNGHKNTAVGFVSMLLNNGCTSCTGGDNNTAIGARTMLANSVGNRNTAIGYRTLENTDLGSDNTAIGHQALYIFNQTGLSSGNTSFGFHSGYYVTAGSRNSGFGSESMWAYNIQTAGEDNVALGYRALYECKEQGTNNYQPPYFDVTYSNTAVGANTMTNCITMNAISGNFPSKGNTAVGYHNLPQIGGGRNNTTLGFEVMTNARGHTEYASGTNPPPPVHWSSHNVAVGPWALKANTEGYENVAIGKILELNQYPIRNVGIGAAMSNYVNSSSSTTLNTSGNTAAGYLHFGNQNTGKQNTAFGYGADCIGGAWNNVTCIGNFAWAPHSDAVVVGNSNLIAAETQNYWNFGSDGRFKFNIKEDVVGIDFIKLLRPVNYNFDKQAAMDFFQPYLSDTLRSAYKKYSTITNPDKRYTGFIAQEVEEAGRRSGFEIHGASKPTADHQKWTLNYYNMVMPLIKAIQEQHKLITELQSKREELAAKCKELNGTKVVPVSPEFSNVSVQITPDKCTIHGEFPEESVLIVFRLNGTVAVEIDDLSNPTRREFAFAERLLPGLYVYAVVTKGTLLASEKFIIDDTH